MGETGEEEIPWDKLFASAEKIIAQTMDSLPGPIKSEASKITTLLERWPPEEDSDQLGSFHGFEPNRLSESRGPIFIFVGAIYELCEEEELDFEDEVRITYLHELGHHLGMDEDDLEERGLG